VANQQANEFNEAMLYDTHRPLLKKIRKWLNPVLKLMINPAAISGAMKREQVVLFYEVVHNLVVEITRLGIEVHNMKMRVESRGGGGGRDQRRARALEGSVQYRPQRRQESPRSPTSPESPRSPGGQPSYGSMPVEAAPRAEPPINVTSAPPVFGAREQNGGQGQQIQGQNQNQNQNQGRPDGQNGGNRPEGGRRRRRRRRRRPGQNMADQTGSQGSPGSMGSGGPTGPMGSTAAPGGGSPRPQSEAEGFDEGPDDGPDDDGAGNP
jgi:hypothetical protein